LILIKKDVANAYCRPFYHLQLTENIMTSLLVPKFMSVLALDCYLDQRHLYDVLILVCAFQPTVQWLRFLHHPLLRLGVVSEVVGVEEVLVPVVVEGLLSATLLC
jgi:hypothetical protein